MRTFLGIVVAPFLGAALVTTLVMKPLPRAIACECTPDAFWVIEDVKVEGAQAPWPQDGQLYPGRLSLWAEGTTINLSYEP